MGRPVDQKGVQIFTSESFKTGFGLTSEGRNAHHLFSDVILFPLYMPLLKHGGKYGISLGIGVCAVKGPYSDLHGFPYDASEFRWVPVGIKGHGTAGLHQAQSDVTPHQARQSFCPPSSGHQRGSRLRTSCLPACPGAITCHPPTCSHKGFCPGLSRRGVPHRTP